MTNVNMTFKELFFLTKIVQFLNSFYFILIFFFFSVYLFTYFSILIELTNHLLFE